MFGVSSITGETQEAIDRRHDPEREASLDAGSCDIRIRAFIRSQRDDLADPRELGSRQQDRCFVHGAEQLTRQDLQIYFGVGVRIGPTRRVGHLAEVDTRPAPLNTLGLSEDDLINFTPELKQEALEIMRQYRVGGPYMPPLPNNHTEDVKGWIGCSGGLNITNPAVLDPETGFLYQPSGPGCSGRTVQPGADVDAGVHGCTSDSGDCTTTGTTVSDWVQGGGVGWGGPQGLPMHKPPYSKITAIDMNTGEHAWEVSVGEASDQLKRHAALRNTDLSGVGGRGRAVMMVTKSLLFATEGSNGPPVLNAHDKATGVKLGTTELPAPGMYGMMTYMHEGRQYIVVQIGAGGEFAGSLAALRLPD